MVLLGKNKGKWFEQTDQKKEERMALGKRTKSQKPATKTLFLKPPTTTKGSRFLLEEKYPAYLVFNDATLKE